MGEMVDKGRDKLEEAQGIARQKAGEVLGDEEMQAQGDQDRTKADLKQAGEKVKDVFRH